MEPLRQSEKCVHFSRRLKPGSVVRTLEALTCEAQVALPENSFALSDFSSRAVNKFLNNMAKEAFYEV